MSQQPNPTSPKPDTKAARVPKLRFPEFRNAEGWEMTAIGQLGEVVTGSTPSTVLPEYYGGDRLFVSPSDISDGRFVEKTKTTLSALGFRQTRPVKANSILFSCIGTIGKIAQNRQECATNQQINSVVPHSNISDGFAYYALCMGVGKIADLAGKQTIPIVNKSLFSSVELAFPKLPEQQKIADCLSSLDELITAQARKVDALKTHKKGLMQQLFPREGETQPRLRFPEFQDAGEWEEKSLDYLCDKIMDGTHFSPQTKVGPRPYLTSKNIKSGRIDLSNLSYISEEEHSEIYKRCPVKVRDVLLTKDGANTGNCALNDLDFEFSLLSSVAVLRGNPVVLRQDFLFQSIRSDRTQALIAESMSGQAITRITLTKISGFSIPFTTVNEQHRIADCLTFLDDLITATTQELETLKTHKKGLMQQLFPSAEVVEV